MPQRNAKKASFIVTVCFLLGFGLMYFANFVSYRYILQILGIAAFAIGIFMTTRYIIRRYAYSIQKSGDGDYDFVVNQVQGKRSTVVCRVNMDEICAFYPDDGTRKPPKGVVKYDYCQNPSDGAYFIEAELREGNAVVRFSPDGKMAEIIESLRPKKTEIGSDGK